ncbi:MAG: lactate utilization protein B [Rhodothermales bacterium]
MSHDFMELPVVDHAANAERFNADVERTTWHDESLWHIRGKRDRAAASVEGWEELRELASQIKSHMLSRLDHYLVQFERQAEANGVHVHWAADAAEHNRIVHAILERHGAQRIVKSKSMLTEECGLNPYLEQHGIEVVDTDLGERIVQLMEEPPSHLVTPAIHVRKEEIGALFHEKLGTDAGSIDPQYLTEAMRQNLRARFLDADGAVTGVNFGVAETGGFVVVTNEGNADLGVHLAPVHVACMGIEKLIPRADHLGVFLRLLARSATGQPLSIYTSHFHRPTPGRELHVVLVDNGRTNQLARPDFRESLKCIRCGACLNTCPVYRRSGGHSYGTTLSGPIGSILTPGLDLEKFANLPFASTLCGSCGDVCPVKIDIPRQLHTWRQVAARAGHLSRGKRLVMRWAGRIFGRPPWYRRTGRVLRSLLRLLPRKLLYGPHNAWGRARELPNVPRQSFGEWYEDNRGKG